MAAADSFFGKAEQALKKRNYDYAIELWQQGLMIDPDRIEERQKLRATAVRRCQENGGDTTGGRMFMVKNMGLLGKVKKLGIQKKFEEQIVELERLLATAPQYVSGLMDLGNAFTLTQRTQLAVQAYTQVVEVDRTNVDGWKSLGRLHETLKDVDKAVRCWEQVRAARPEDNEAGKAIRDLSASAMMAKADERQQKGDGSFRDLLKDEDESAKLEKKASIIRTADDAQTAIQLKQEELDADPDNPRLHRDMGDLYLKMNDFDNTRVCYQKALELNPQDPYAKDKLGNLEERIYDHAVDQAQSKVNNNPDDEATNQELAAAKASRDKFLLGEYERRVIAHPTDYGLKYRYGGLLFKEGEQDRAIQQFQNSVKDPKFAVDSRHMIGRAFYAKKLFDLAIKELNNALGGISEADSGLGKEVRYHLGEAYLDKGNREKALDCFEEIMSVDIGYRDVSTRVDEIRGME